MERAALRPVPRRPSGPVEPTAALAHVEATFPGLDDVARQALALVDLVGRTRPQLRAETGVGEEELAAALTRARKALRRASFPLPGSGWCERAERLLSDELDGALKDPGPRRLAAHLANCDRCVEHERRLGQARDQLVAGFDAARETAPAPEPERPGVADEPDPEPAELPDLPPEAPAPTAEPVDPLPPPEPVAAAGRELRLVEPAAEAPPTPTVPEPADPAPADPVPSDPEPSGPVPADPPAAADARPVVSAESAAEDAVAAALPEPRFSVAALVWTSSLALAVLLAIAALALTIYAITGGGI